MLVKSNRSFFDVKENVYRNAGDIFTVSKERFDQLNELVNGFVEEEKQEKQEKKEVGKPKK